MIRCSWAGELFLCKMVSPSRTLGRCSAVYVCDHAACRIDGGCEIGEKAVAQWSPPENCISPDVQVVCRFSQCCAEHKEGPIYASSVTGSLAVVPLVEDPDILMLESSLSTNKGRDAKLRFPPRDATKELVFSGAPHTSSEHL